MSEGAVHAVAQRWECPCGFSITAPYPNDDLNRIEEALRPHLLHLAQDWQRQTGALRVALDEIASLAAGRTTRGGVAREEIERIADRALGRSDHHDRAP